MSTTFSIEGLAEEQGHDLPCGACGVSLRGGLDPAEQRHLDCRTCGGYGGPEVLPEPRHELNVANGSAAGILRALGLPDGPDGEADPKDLLVALELRGAELKARYREALERIATRAVKWDRRVVWS